MAIWNCRSGARGAFGWPFVQLWGRYGKAKKRGIQAQLHSLTARDLQLWSLGFLVMVVLAISVVAIAVPGISTTPVQVNLRYVPQLAVGLITLVALLNFYIASKKKELNQTRLALVRELALNEKLEQFSTVDPETQLFNQNSLSHLFANEMKRSNRLGTTTALVVMEVGWSNASTPAQKDPILEVSALFRRTFRGSDTVVRLAETRFLLVMPMTNQEQAGIALRRLTQVVEDWNLNTTGAEVLLRWTLGSCLPGQDAWTVFKAAQKHLDEMLEVPTPPAKSRPASVKLGASSSAASPVQPTMSAERLQHRA